ncbi:MAG: NAD(P)-dependent oxidoreductase [Ilumatobacteraceae bacterium]
MGAAALRRRRELHPPRRRRSRVDVRQGRVRPAGRRDGARPRPRRDARRRVVRTPARGVTERGVNLFGANVTILGGGGITEALIPLLHPFDTRITVVRNRMQEMDGVDEVVEADRYIDALVGADLVVVALALTPDTDGMLSRNEFELMEPHAGSSTSLVAATSSPTTWSGRCGRARSVARHSMSPTPSRCRTAIRCGACRTAS